MSESTPFRQKVQDGKLPDPGAVEPQRWTKAGKVRFLEEFLREAEEGGIDASDSYEAFRVLHSMSRQIRYTTMVDKGGLGNLVEEITGNYVYDTYGENNE